MKDYCNVFTAKADEGCIASNYSRPMSSKLLAMLPIMYEVLSAILGLQLISPLNFQKSTKATFRPLILGISLIL